LLVDGLLNEEHADDAIVTALGASLKMVARSQAFGAEHALKNPKGVFSGVCR
jgi:hypothetical protein